MILSAYVENLVILLLQLYLGQKLAGPVNEGRNHSLPTTHPLRG